MKILILVLITFILTSCNALKTLTDGETELDDKFFQGGNSQSLNEGLISFYNFNSLSPTVNDYSGLNPLSNVAATGPFPAGGGINGNAPDCGGATASGSGIYLNNSVSNFNFSATDSYAISFHMNNSLYTSSMKGHVFFGAGGGSANPAVYVGDIDGIGDTDDIRFEIGANHYLWSNSFAAGQNHFVFNVRNGGTNVDFYLNGNFIGTNSNSPMACDATVFSVCADNAGASKINGWIDSLGFWSRNLSQNEINMLNGANTHLD